MSIAHMGFRSSAPAERYVIGEINSNTIGDSLWVDATNKPKQMTAYDKFEITSDGCILHDESNSRP